MALYNMNNYINTDIDIAFLRLRHAIFQRAVEDLKFLHYPEEHKDFKNGKDAYIFLSNKNKWYDTLFLIFLHSTLMNWLKDVNIMNQRKEEKKLKNFYNLKEIEKKNALYNIIIGERSNGKTYACLYKIVKNFIEKVNRVRWFVGGKMTS